MFVRAMKLALAICISTSGILSSIALAFDFEFKFPRTHPLELEGVDAIQIRTGRGGWGLADSYQVDLQPGGQLTFTGRSNPIDGDPKSKDLTPSVFDGIAQEIIDLNIHMTSGKACRTQMTDQPPVYLTLYLEGELTDVSVNTGCIDSQIDSHLAVIHKLMDLSDMVELTRDPLKRYFMPQ